MFVSSVCLCLLYSIVKRCYYRLVIDHDNDRTFLLDTDDPDCRRLVNEPLPAKTSDVLSSIRECEVLQLREVHREYTIRTEKGEEGEGEEAPSFLRFLLSLFRPSGQKIRTVRYGSGRTIVAIGHLEQVDGTVRIVPEKVRDLARLVTILNVGPRSVRSMQDVVSYAGGDGQGVRVMMFLLPDVSSRPYKLFNLTGELPEVVYAEPSAFRVEESAVLSYTCPMTSLRHVIAIGRVEAVRDDVTGRTYVAFVPYIDRDGLLSYIQGTQLYRTLVGDLHRLREIVEAIRNIVQESRDAKPEVIEKLNSLINYVTTRLDKLSEAVALLSRPIMHTVESVRLFMSNILRGVYKVRELYGDMVLSEFIALLEEGVRTSEIIRVIGDVTNLRNIMYIEHLAQQRQAQQGTQQQSPIQQLPIMMQIPQSQPQPILVATGQGQAQTQGAQSQSSELERLTRTLEELSERLRRLEQEVREMRGSRPEEHTI